MCTATGNACTPVNFENLSHIHNTFLTGDDLISRVPKYCQKASGHLVYKQPICCIISLQYSQPCVACLPAKEQLLLEDSGFLEVRIFSG